jgi:hypothetical protein
MMRGFLGSVLAVLLAATASCVDVDQGESGSYGSPCSSWGDLLLCGRESGGADPQGGGSGSPGGGSQAATCDTVCEVVVGCFPGQITQQQCVTSCLEEGIPQASLDCIMANQCNYPQACFGETQ